MMDILPTMLTQQFLPGKDFKIHMYGTVRYGTHTFILKNNYTQMPPMRMTMKQLGTFLPKQTKLNNQTIYDHFKIILSLKIH